jgi:tRNA-modifying protein YgfZ
MIADYDQARTHAALFDVSSRGKIEVAGADAARFLHNLSTNDIVGLPAGAGCEAFLVNLKAKVIAYLLVHHVRQPDGRDAFWLDMAPGVAEKALKHLDHHLISEQVELADRTDELAQFHVAGPQARAILEKALQGSLADLGELRHEVRTLAGAPCQVRRHSPLGLPGYDILCPTAHAAVVKRLLTESGAHPAGPAAYEVLRVEAGTPVQGPDIDEERFVVEVGRGTRAVCYTKGCYLGQEPIVMARDRGHVNRALLGLKIAGDGPVAPSSRLTRDGTEVGQVTSSVVSPRLGAIALAYIRRGSQEPGTRLRIDGEGAGRACEVAALPFDGGGAS